MRGREGHHLDLARRLVDVHERRLRGEAVRRRDIAAQILVEHRGRRIVERLRDERPPLLAQVTRADDTVVGNSAQRLVTNEDRPVAHVEPIGRRFELRGREREQLATHLLGREARGVAGDERRAAGVRTDVPRLDRRVGVDDLDALERHAERLRHDHGKDGLRALPDLRRARDHRYLAEIIELHDGAAAVRAIDPGPAAHVKHPRVADAALPAGPRRRHVTRDVLGHGVETLRHRARRDDEALGVGVARLRHVAPA